MPHVLRVLGKSPTRILITKVALYALNVAVYLHNKAARSTNAQLVIIWRAADRYISAETTCHYCGWVIRRRRHGFLVT